MAEVIEDVGLRGIAPIVPARRVTRSVEFYTQVLGFTLAERNTEMTFAHVERDGTGLILLDLADAKAVQATGHYLSAYVFVDGVERLWDEVAPRLEQLPVNRVTPLFTKPDGRREFHVRDPDGFLLFFGEKPGR